MCHYSSPGVHPLKLAIDDQSHLMNFVDVIATSGFKLIFHIEDQGILMYGAEYDDYKQKRE